MSNDEYLRLLSDRLRIWEYWCLKRVELGIDKWQKEKGYTSE